MIKKILALGFGVISYLLFFVVFNYTILFIGNIVVEPSLDSIGSYNNIIDALMINIGLLTAFALQHSIMARPAFKRWWTKFVPEAIERSTYVLASSLILAAIVYFWQPLGGVIWHVENQIAVGILYTIFAIGWAILFLASFQINHFDLFGLRQVWLYFTGKPYTPLAFKIPFLYRYTRHPLYVGMMMGLWAAPVMTVAHLVFALLCTGYVFVGTLLEEKDLEKALPEYKQYKKEVPMFIPSFKNKTKLQPVAESI
ncbi:MAG: isoprenylcysteine carboxylmethyltransferase family protein [Gammaproteobacteria bacterium]|nr:isoprenylcysteine carboxylmethyltransferase family protein [Gammaproteobacteria bacterium]MDH5593359.1 isoprenylcysteine carboxylmethyltransferase family protein [Gammaproteobacteria bacterium]MDH5614844.1 isoprenylcysteine carboxylmethyltransferase family protein [Gammaproteobacteria bacterium]